MAIADLAGMMDLRQSSALLTVGLAGGQSFAVKKRRLEVTAADVAQAKDLYFYMEKLDTGFSGFGVTISYGLAARIIYPTLTVVVGVILPALFSVPTESLLI